VSEKWPDHTWPKRRGDAPDEHDLVRPVKVRCLFCPGAAFVGTLAEGRAWFTTHQSEAHPDRHADDIAGYHRGLHRTRLGRLRDVA
jgi:hypothetical protein